MKATRGETKILAERANRAAIALEGFAAKLESGALSLEAGLQASASLAGLRVAAGLPSRLTRVGLAYHGLEMSDLFRKRLHLQKRVRWVETLATGRRLIWQLLAAGEVRAARLLSSAVLTSAGRDFVRIREDLSPEEFHLSASLEALAEFAFVSGPRSLFDSLADETVYDHSPAGGAAAFTFRGSLVSRPAYQRLPNQGDPERFRKHVLDELAVHTAAMMIRGADPRQAAPLEICSLIVLGYRVNLTLRRDLIPSASMPYLSLVEHLLP